MTDPVKQCVGVLIDRICELSIENELLRGMLSHPEHLPAGSWEPVLDVAMRSSEAHGMRQKFAKRRDSVVAALERGQIEEAMLELRTHALPN
jgi:hypothetical protein